MSEPPHPSPPSARPASLKRWFEQALFFSRWLMAPFYIGLVVGLLGLLVVFVRELIHDAPLLITTADPDRAIVMALSLIDLSLSGNLMLIVILSGYENFVAKLAMDDHPDRPDWLGHVDFAGLKMKLIGSVVVISAIALLKAFMDLVEPDSPSPEPGKLAWMIGLHAAFLLTGIALAVMDRLDHKASD